MPKYMIVLSRSGSGESKFFDNKILADEFFNDMMIGYNDWDHVQLYYYCGGRYSLLRDVLKGDCL